MNELLIILVVILLPGITATIISDKLTTHSKWDSFKFGLYSLVLGIFTYAILQVCVWVFNFLSALSINKVKWSSLGVWDIAVNGGAKVIAWEVVVAIGLSIPVAFFASWLINYKVFNKVAKKLRVTEKYGDENLYSYYLNAKEIEWIYIRDPENNLTYQGRVVSHSENDKIQEIVLSDVSVYRYEDSELLYSIPTIYLSREAGSFIIEAVPNDYLEEVFNDG